jgi:pilus assembly protein CpaC
MTLACPPIRRCRRASTLAVALLLCATTATASAQTPTRSRTPTPTPPPAAPAASVPDDGPSCSGGISDPIAVRLNAGRSTFVNLPEAVVRRSLGDPEVVDARMVSPQVMYLASRRIGATNAIMQGRSGRCVAFEIAVTIDTDSVQSKLAELMPEEKALRVSAAADTLILTGVVSDATVVERAIAIANAYVRSSYQQGAGKDSSTAARAGLQNAENGSPPLVSRVLNMLTVGSAQQVMLEVKVAEVSKTLLDKLGASVAGSRTNGMWTYQMLSNFLTGAGGTIGAVKDGANQLLIDAEKRDGLIRILAEPSVMAISGQEGSFLAGGKVLIPVAQSTVAGSAAVTLEEKEFGVGLKFVPTVLSGGRINLKVAPEVSELSREGIGVSAGTLGTRSVLPLITTRRAATTVQLADGQSFAIGGLLKSSIATNIKALPVLGEIPILGALFRSTDFQSEKTELVFIVTPRLVTPLPPDFRLPTDNVGEPTRKGVFIEGRLDAPGTGASPATAPGTGASPATAPGTDASPAAAPGTTSRRGFLLP